MIVASRTLALANDAASDTTVVAGLAEWTDGTASAASIPFTVALVCENTNCALVARSATSENPSLIVSRRTVSGTAYTVCVSSLENTSRVAPDGAVTTTPNTTVPALVPSVIDVTVTTRVAAVYP